jgi:hypothetical protein
MRTAILIATFLSIPMIGHAQTTCYVPDDFPTIQGCISDPLVVNGDTIIVRPNTYVENIDFLGKATILKSEQRPEVMVIDEDQTGNAAKFINGEGTDVVIEGFTLTNVKGDLGGGILCDGSSSLIIQNNSENIV